MPQDSVILSYQVKITYYSNEGIFGICIKDFGNNSYAFSWIFKNVGYTTIILAFPNIT